VNIYCGNIAYSTSEDDLRDLFGRYGEVTAVRVITDRDTGRSKGFGFVEMSDDDQAKKQYRPWTEMILWVVILG